MGRYRIVLVLLLFAVAGCTTVEQHLLPPDGTTFEVTDETFDVTRDTYPHILRASFNVMSKDSRVVYFEQDTGYISGAGVDGVIEVLVSPPYANAKEYFIAVVMPEETEKRMEKTDRIIADISSEIRKLSRRPPLAQRVYATQKGIDPAPHLITPFTAQPRVYFQNTGRKRTYIPTPPTFPRH